MARRKSAEELAIEAELAAAQEDGEKRGGAEDPLKGGEAPAVDETKTQAALPDKKRRAPGAPRFKPDGRLAWLNGWKGRVSLAAVVVVVAVAAFACVSLLRWYSTDSWDGTEDTSWYVDGKNDFTLTSAEQLAGLRALVDAGATFEDAKISLGCNMDMRDTPMKPIGTGLQGDAGKYLTFDGDFDGTGHVIKGLNIEEDQWDDAGLFGEMNGGSVKNLTTEGKVVGQVYVGGIIGKSSGTVVQNCTNRCQVSATKTATGYYQVKGGVGGVIGDWVGIVGEDETELALSGLKNEGEVSARACDVGGVVGLLANTDELDLTVSDLENSGKVTAFCKSSERDEAVGGVIGAMNGFGQASFTNLHNTADVQCSSVLSVGGIFGSFGMPADKCTVSNCSNSGRVSANAKSKLAHIGGFAGYVDDDGLELGGFQNTGELAATNGKADETIGTGWKEVWDTWEEEHPQYEY